MSSIVHGLVHSGKANPGSSSTNAQKYVYKYVDQKGPGGQEVLHKRWIWVIHCMQATNHIEQLIHPGFQTQDRHHEKSKIGVSVAPQKGLMFYKQFSKKAFYCTSNVATDA